jgi:hypothetical protein
MNCQFKYIIREGAPEEFPWHGYTIMRITDGWQQMVCCCIEKIEAETVCRSLNDTRHQIITSPISRRAQCLGEAYMMLAEEFQQVEINVQNQLGDAPPHYQSIGHVDTEPDDKDEK